MVPKIPPAIVRSREDGQNGFGLCLAPELLSDAIERDKSERLAETMEAKMEAYTPDFSLAVQGVKGLCPAGEGYAKRMRHLSDSNLN